MNDLLQAELSAFFGYEPYNKAGYLTGNSRNRTYSLKFETKYGTVQLTIPRDCNENFSPAFLPTYGHRDDNWEELVIKLYQTGVTTLETKKTPPSKESDVTNLKKYPHSVLHHYKLHKTTKYGHQMLGPCHRERTCLYLSRLTLG